MNFRDIIIDLLKFGAALAVIASVIYYWLIQGLPPRGRGRWRNVLSQRKGRHHDGT